MSARSGRLGSGSYDWVAFEHVGALVAGAAVLGLAATGAGTGVSSYVTPEQPARAASPATEARAPSRRRQGPAGASGRVRVRAPVVVCVLIGTPRSAGRPLAR